MGRDAKRVCRGLTSAATGIVPAPVATLTIGEFAISDLGRGKFWLANASGEGLETTAGKLEKALRKYFEREF